MKKNRIVLTCLAAAAAVLLSVDCLAPAAGAVSVSCNPAKKLALDKLDGLRPRIIAVEDVLYLLDTDLFIRRVKDGVETMMGNVRTDMQLDCATGFDVTRDYTYVSEPTRAGGRTLRYVTTPETGELTLDRVIAGYMVDDDTFYQSRILSEDGGTTGHTCVITIRDADGRIKDTITLTDEEEIAGVQYLGKDQEGMHVVKQLTLLTREDGSCRIVESVRPVCADAEATTAKTR